MLNHNLMLTTKSVQCNTILTLIDDNVYIEFIDIKLGMNFVEKVHFMHMLKEFQVNAFSDNFFFLSNSRFETYVLCTLFSLSVDR